MSEHLPTTDEIWMQRCFDLARRGAGWVAPNPMVGAVLVHENKIIGEGWHQRWGESHAEVNAFGSVTPQNRLLLPKATLYCNLEPCFHTGKTPPCVLRIIAEKVARVVISNVDPNPLVAGQSIAKLSANAVAVTTGILEQEGQQLNRTFFHWITQRKPYVVLKWAQSADGFIGKSGQQVKISGPESQRLVHRWRSESSAVLVGTTTAVTDNPRLDNRFFPGPTPLRIALDWDEKIPLDHHLLDGSQASWILGPKRPALQSNTLFLAIPKQHWIPSLLESLYEAQKAILLVEGGANVHNQFLQQSVVQELRVIKSATPIGSGISAPGIPPGYSLVEHYPMGSDRVEIYRLDSTIPPVA
ncbi:MAG: bifunctional diaminohydroxyphosphoribosylaminopyrimidine deaminase/5-amino-6-(5-phosphoribosylamino)uracil reductase RibD [Lewinellaceae bacterium]|nr:bifunctional diaminohydroxyphosphoribosylaminopyrimidine deaminase/5-amino-6-(5-phosphoribosylamino)uracil reductase RibD [Lewinellaceae bacterium]